VVELTPDFYRRNYIEGLFLSSGIIRDADYTMEQLIAVARTLRERHLFAGYVHLKTIPEASPELIDEAARWADRLSINVELPSQQELDTLAPGKRLTQIGGAMGRIRDGIQERADAPRESIDLAAALRSSPAGRGDGTPRRAGFLRSLRRLRAAGDRKELVRGPGAESTRAFFRAARCDCSDMLYSRARRCSSLPRGTSRC
jgi:hypothetical protein